MDKVIQNRFRYKQFFWNFFFWGGVWMGGWVVNVGMRVLNKKLKLVEGKR